MFCLYSSTVVAAMFIIVSSSSSSSSIRTVGAFQPLVVLPSGNFQHRRQLHLNHPLSPWSSFLALSTASASTSASTEFRRRNETNTTITIANASVTTYPEDSPARRHEQEMTTLGSITTPSTTLSTARKVATTSAVTKTATKRTNNNKKSPVRMASTIEELLTIMNRGFEDRDDEEEKNDGVESNNGGDNTSSSSSSSMTLILFHAHYCKICQRAAMQLIRAAKEYPSVTFAKIEASVLNPEPADKLKSLGVTKFPFVQLYRDGMCVASFSTGPTHMFMRKIRDTLDLCLDRDDECWGGFMDEFANEIQTNQVARNKLLIQYEQEQQ